MTHEETLAYWSKRIHKKWVVTLTAERKIDGRKKTIRDVLYIRAKTEAGAIRTARLESGLTGRMGASARLASADDLGCTAGNALLD